MPKILTINEIDQRQWDELVKTSPTSSFFQTRICYDFYCSLNCLQPIFYAVSDNEKLVGVICGYFVADGGKIKQFFSRRAIFPGGALLDKNISKEALNVLLKKVIDDLGKKAIYIEFRNYDDFSEYNYSFSEVGFEYLPYLNFHIDTQDINNVQKNISSSKKKYIKTTLENGAEVVDIQTDTELKEFYKIIYQLYKTKIKTPLFPYEFFEKFMKTPNFKLLGIKYREKVIGGCGLVMLPQKSVYEWFACGINNEFDNIYTSSLISWAGIEFAAKNNYQRYDMMGAGKPDEDYGVRNFKKEFGGKLVEHGRFLYICNKFLYNIGKFYIKKLKF